MNSYPHEIFGNGQQTLYFGHANAYAPGAYRAIIEPLAQNHQVQAYLQRPLWQPSPDIHSINNWHDLAEDVIGYFEQQNLKGLVAVGHSLGALTAFLAGNKRPDLIKAVVMIEPVLFSRGFCLVNQFMPKVLKKRVAIINKALNRPDAWQDLQQAFDFHRRARAFKRISDEILWDIINACVVPTEDGKVTLRYHKKWEAKCYASVTYFRGQLMKSNLPLLVFRGDYTDTVPEGFWRRWQKQHQPHHQLVSVEKAGHLLPFERPDVLNPVIADFVAQYAG